jgi:hypothetical protein
MPGIGRDKHDRPLASVHRLDPNRPRREGSLPEPSAALKGETPALDPNAGLSMLGTLDLGDAELRSPDEILASLDAVPSVSGSAHSRDASLVDERVVAADALPADDVQSDEILRELEQHHQRTQLTPAAAAPRGSAELGRGVARRAQTSWRRRIRSNNKTHGARRPRRGSLLFAAAAVVLVCAVVGSIAIPGQHRAPGSLLHVLHASRTATLTAAAVRSAGTPAKSANLGAKSATDGARRSERASRSRKLHARGSGRQHVGRHTVTSTSGRPSSTGQHAGSGAANENGVTNASYVSSTGADEPAVERPASTIAQPLSTTSSGSSDSNAGGPSGLGGEVGGNCNPKCS